MYDGHELGATSAGRCMPGSGYQRERGVRCDLRAKRIGQSVVVLSLLVDGVGRAKAAFLTVDARANIFGAGHATLPPGSRRGSRHPTPGVSLRTKTGAGPDLHQRDRHGQP